jgi:hypothetical protein
MSIVEVVRKSVTTVETTKTPSVVSVSAPGPQGPSGNANPAALISADAANALVLGTDSKFWVPDLAPALATKAERRTAALTLHVRLSGNDLTGNGSEDFPFATLRRALESLHGWNARIYPVDILLGDGVHADGHLTIATDVRSLDAPTRPCILVRSVSGNRAACTISCYPLSVSGYVGFEDLTIYGATLALEAGAFVYTDNVVLDWTDVSAEQAGAWIQLYNPVFSTSQANPLRARYGGAISVVGSATIVGDPTYTDFAVAKDAGLIRFWTQVTGSFTGRKYAASRHSTIDFRVGTPATAIVGGTGGYRDIGARVLWVGGTQGDVFTINGVGGDGDGNFALKNVNGVSLVGAGNVTITKADLGLSNVDNVSAASLRDRATHTGTQQAATISDFGASARAQIEAMLQVGANVSFVFAGSGATRTLTVSATTGGGTFAQNRWQANDFHIQNALCYPFLGAAISTGSNAGTITAALIDPIKHPGVLGLASSATANSGYRYLTSLQQFRAAAGLTFYGVFATPPAFTNITTRIGFHDSTSSADAVDGIGYLEILPTGIASFKTANNSARTTNATTYTMTVSTWYAVLFDVISTAEVRCRVFDNNGAVLLDVTNTTNIPSASGRECLAGVVNTNAGTTASVVGLVIDYMGLGPAKPDWLP